jgi:hypothetical protein
MLLIILLLSQPLYYLINKLNKASGSGASGRVEGWLSKIREFNAVVLQF